MRGSMLLAALALLTGAAAHAAAPGAAVSYQLPGPPGTTWRVTLAATDAGNPDGIVSTFAAGVARTVTAENGGRFTETWDGLDDNFMPVPPGTYGVKGIYMPAQKWDIDGQWHSVVARYAGLAQAWRPALADDRKRPIVDGDPCSSPLGDVDVGPNGVGVFCYQYLENAHNFYLADFNRPINYEQVLASYASGGAAGGQATATDGHSIWVAENEKFVFRADKPWGKDNGRYRKGVHQPEGSVTALAAWRDEAAGKSYVYLAERGKLQFETRSRGHTGYAESPTERINKIVILDGDSAARLGEIAVAEPTGLVARWGDRLWVLHAADGGLAVSAVPLKAGLPQGTWQVVMRVPAGLTPGDLEVDSRGLIYLSDPAANKVHQFSSEGKPLRTFGRLPAQKPGAYDPETLIGPGKLACRRDADGSDRLIIVERDGPNRASEWSADGRLLRQWQSAQTFTNSGYAVDPRQPDRFYLRGHGGWLTRFRVDYATGEWHEDAVWPNFVPPDSPLAADGRLAYPRLLYRGDTRYLAFGRGYVIFREADDRWLPSAAIINRTENNKRQSWMWRDANGDGRVQDDEYKSAPMTPPPGTLRYWGESWMDDFSLVAIGEGTADVWRLAPTGFDAHGNPQYDPGGWKKLLTDPFFDARAKGTATALRGGNEAGDRFNSSWAMVAGSPQGDYYVNARSGANFSANFGAQHKVSRYVPDGRGEYALKWRVGRVALQGTAQPGEIYGSIQVTPPTGGILSLVDQSRMGFLLYTDDGLYVDTLFADIRQVGREAKVGPYTQGGEFFAGYHFLNRENDKVYLAIGKVTPVLFEAVGWTGKQTPVRRLETVARTVTLAASQIAPAPDFALAARRSGGGTAARVARFAPLPGGGPALDGSLRGWESCEPAAFRADDKQTVEVRCGYDPATLYLRWQVRLGRRFEPRDLAPADRLFTHDREADTVSFYIQGDPAAAPAKGREGRPGDARFVFGIFKDAGQARPVALAMYPKWSGKENANPLTYKSPVGAAAFEHVGLLASARLGHAVDADGQGFVIAAAIPRAAVPMLPAFAGDFLTQVNFDATLAGHNRFWWANADGSASRETYDEPTEAHLYPGSWSQARFEAIGQLPIRVWSAIGPFGFAKLKSLHPRNDRPEICRTLAEAVFPPERTIDLAATYEGDMAQTRTGRRTLKWVPAGIAGDMVTFETVLNWKSYEDEGAEYLLTYINSPQAVEVKLKALDAHGHHAVRAWLNDQPLPATFPPGQSAKDLHQTLDPAKAVALKAGWNKLLVRFDLVWGENKLGLSLDAPPQVLWSLGFSPTPPK